MLLSKEMLILAIQKESSAWLNIHDLIQRELAFRRDEKKYDNIPRIFEIPKINFEANDYIDWQNTEDINPPALFQYLDDEFMNFIGTGGILNILKFLCNTQIVERHINLVNDVESLEEMDIFVLR
ncbi:unnamed protein product [Psylliodes chrysocephalus]|uniref:Uncharacterized protein n=1 Tax=Psylliodes chrysocephalus TaxID=3402493 RepID=A0A9P0CWY7_9CUCU|nr:unnamed protein product [Psylliodes chrysocephala]